MNITIIEKNKTTFDKVKGGEAFVYKGCPFLAFNRKIRDYYSNPIEDEFVDEPYNAVSLITGRPVFLLEHETVHLIDFEGTWKYI